MKKAIIGIVDSRERAENVLAGLQAAGIGPEAVSVLLPDKSGSKDFAHEHNTKAPEGAVAGAGTGGLLGGTLGLLAGIGALAIPGFGPLIAAGPLMAALSGAAAGAAVGGIAGGLIGLGIPELEAKHYEGKIKGGNILVAVHVESSEQQEIAERALKASGASDVSATSEASVPKKEAAARDVPSQRSPRPV
jgi:hypothetical protein